MMAGRDANVAVEGTWRRAMAMGLFVVTVLLFARTIGNGFVNYDDPDYVTENARVKAGLSFAGAWWALGAREASNWHPLTWLSHQLDVTLWGMTPSGHHATSVALHGLNAALAFLLLARLTGRRWASAAGAAWWAWHPLRVESVAWVAERKDVLSGALGLVALIAYVAHAERRRDGAAGAGKMYALALGAFALGLMAKPMLVTLPCVMLLMDFWPLRRREGWGRLAWEKAPFFVLSAASSVATYLAQAAGGSVSLSLGLSDRVANATVAIASYLGLTAWPSGLAVLYPHPGAWPAVTVAACAVVIVAASVVAWRWRERRPWVAVGWLWFVGTLVPVLGLVQVGLQAMADRYTYLPALGIALAAVGVRREGTVVGGTWRWVAVSVVLVALCARTWEQLGVWRDSFTLFDRAVAVTRNNHVAYDNRGHHLAQAGRLEEAMADYRRALAIQPGYMNANNNLGHALQKQGRPAEAVPFYRAALKANPNHVEVRNNIANALSDIGQLDEALEHYEFALARRPRHVNALNGSAVALAMKNRPQEALKRLEEALRIEPGNASAHHNLGNVLSMLGRNEEAGRHYRRAVELQPGGTR